MLGLIVGNVGLGDVGQTGLGSKRAPGQSGVVRDGEVYGETVTYPTNDELFKMDILIHPIGCLMYPAVEHL